MEQDRVNKINSIGSAYSQLAQVYYEMAVATQADDKTALKRLDKEVTYYTEIITMRTDEVFPKK